jgi:hypothetical protein
VGTGKQQRDTAEISGLGLRHLCRAASPAGWRHTSAAGTGAQAASRAPRRSPSVRFAIARPKLVGSPKKTTGSSCYVDQALKASLRNTKSRRLNVRPAARSMLLCTRTCFSLFGLCCPTRRPIAPPYPNRPNQQTCARATVRAPSCNSALPWSRLASHRSITPSPSRGPKRARNLLGAHPSVAGAPQTRQPSEVAAARGAGTEHPPVEVSGQGNPKRPRPSVGGTRQPIELASPAPRTARPSTRLNCWWKSGPKGRRRHNSP